MGNLNSSFSGEKEEQEHGRTRAERWALAKKCVALLQASVLVWSFGDLFFHNRAVCVVQAFFFMFRREREEKRVTAGVRGCTPNASQQVLLNP